MNASHSDRILIFDTTLRDGEQCPGATLHVDEKLTIARQLARLGVATTISGTLANFACVTTTSSFFVKFSHRIAPPQKAVNV